ncbi:DNA-binding transcriptional regulator, LysR family [Ferrimonas sediminum]|uniref:DNA-binding transcriptional regulator, LysR family n=1 Tax=Ferrimonas sediminum TaxID=718193 RepID=A0A1G8SXW1_9GAMM|nr:LysR family transcriptional regulator [Ferrimonas sediminum]SDJ34087.1 DNA-binding transcriptional regulator, LysR family [Ferrimonas sediminum]
MTSVNIDKLKDINLFVIRAFCLVYQHGNSIAVAGILDVPPSKISRSLNALRQSFSDQLFIRRQHGFEPTPLADNLYPILSRLLGESEEIAAIGHFKEMDHHNNLHIITPPQLAINLIHSVRCAAENNNDPHSIHLKLFNDSTLDELASNRADAVISFTPAEREGILSKAIATPKKVYLVAREGHPIWDNPSLEQIASYPHILYGNACYPNSQSPMKFYCKRKGIPFQLDSIASDMAAMSNSLLESDAISLLAFSSCASFFRDLKGIQAIQLSSRQFEELISFKTPKTVYLWLKHDQDGRVSTPIWLQKSLEQHILNSLGQAG